MKKVFLGVLIVTAVLVVACGGGSNQTTIAAVPADYAGKTSPLGPDAATAGADLFKTNCESCHGPQGHGDGPAGVALDPAPKNLPDLAAQVGDDYLYWRINTGKEGTSMVAWKGVLTDDQIWQLVAFIRTLK